MISLDAMGGIGGVLLGVGSMAVTAVVARLVRRRIDRRRAQRWQARQPAPSRQVRRAQEKRDRKGRRTG
jgi:hypothetical protein